MLKKEFIAGMVAGAGILGEIDFNVNIHLGFPFKTMYFSPRLPRVQSRAARFPAAKCGRFY